MNAPTAPINLQNKLLGTCKKDEIAAIFRHIAGGYWSKYVSGIAANKIPTDTSDLPGAYTDWADYVASAIFDRAGIAHGDRLGVGELQLHEIHQQIVGQRQLHEQLQKESQNSMGAALAASMALHNAAFRNIVASTNTSKLKEERDVLQSKKNVHAALNKLIAIDLSGLPTGATYTSLISERTLEEAALKVAPAKDVPAKVAAINALNRYIDECQKASTLLNQIWMNAKQITKPAIPSTTTFAIFFPGGTLDPTQIKAGLNGMQLAKDFADELKLEEENVVENSLKEKEEAIKKAGGEGESGDALQQKIFKSYFEGKGASHMEAEKAANYLYSRTFLDAELTTSMNEVQDEMFGPEQEGVMASANNFLNTRGVLRPGKVVEEIKKQLKITDLSTAKYRTLMTAYFAMKKLHDGEGPEYIRCTDSSHLKNEMRRIITRIQERYVQSFINDYSNLKDDEKKLKNKKALTLEMMEELLESGGPDAYKAKVEKLLANVDKNVDWKRRKVKWAGKALGGVGLNLLWRNEKLSARNAVGKTVGGLAGGVKAVGYDAPKSVLQTGWKHRGTIAGVAALSLLGGPVLGVGAWYLGNQLSKKQAA